jgi:hypothetical protein
LAAKKTAKSKLLQHVKEGMAHVNLSHASEDLQKAVVQTLSRAVGHYQAHEMQNDYGLSSLIVHRDNLEENIIGVGLDPEAGEAAELLDIIDNYAKTIESMLDGKLERGEIEFPDVPFIFKTGVEAIAYKDGYGVGGIVDTVELKFTFFGTPFYEVKLKVIANTGGCVNNEIYVVNVFAWNGFATLDSLVLRCASDEDKARLSERGTRYVKYAYGAVYARYTGQVRRHSWTGVKSYRADGRVMLDVGSFRSIDDDQYSNEQQYSGILSANRYDDDEVGGIKSDITVDEKDLWRCFPFLFGFSFKAKQWGRVDVEGLTDIEWRDDSWDKLVLEEDKKALVRAIVEHHQGSFTDIVEDKGGGSIFLLHGPPGQGKTLTAETIAEILHRPLYAISVGELGVSPDQLEERLRTILDLATVWNAVLLLDEADIFLEARDERDIVRNAMVGVFLRLLEYHQGVLFLTTNRVKNIDRAFYSRISIGLEFQDADTEKRQKIWTTLLTAADLLDGPHTIGSGSKPIVPADVQTLATHDLNGRQIKNVIRISQTVAKSEGVVLNIAHLQKVIALTSQFKP